MKTRAPQLRFKYFETRWRPLSIGEHTLSSAFGPRFSSSRYSSSGNIVTLRTTDMDDEGNIRFDNAPLANLDVEEFKEHLLIKDDLVISRSGTIGVTGIFRGHSLPVVPGAFLIRFRLKVDQVCPNFVRLYFNSSRGRRQLESLSAGGVQKNLTGSSILKLTFYAPAFIEQQKIASFLTSFDTKIQQLTKKKSLLEQYKKGVMQKIFKQEIRFKDEKGREYPEWKILRGKDLFVSHVNKRHNGDLPILAATQENGMVYRDSIGIEIQSSEASVKSYKVVEQGDFVISLRSFQGGIEYSEFEGICSPAYTILKPKVKIDNTFFKYYFKKEDFITRLSKTVVGIRDGKQISYEAFSGLKLPFPTVEEQKRIAAFITEIDVKINQVTKQLILVKDFKKGLLQQMFA